MTEKSYESEAERLRHEYNVAIANGLALKARRIERRMKGAGRG